MTKAPTKKPIPPSRWWSFLARPLVRDYEPGYVALSKELQKTSGRANPWSHSALSRFIAKGECSAELACAISDFFKLPRPAFLARSAKEAYEMAAVASKYDSEPVSDIEAEIFEMEERLAERKQQLESEMHRVARTRDRLKRAK